MGKEIGFYEHGSQFEGAGSIPAGGLLSLPLLQSTENQPPPRRLKPKSMSRSFSLLLICSLRLFLERSLSLQLQRPSLSGARVAITSQQLLSLVLLSVPVHCSQGKGEEAVRDLCALLHRGTRPNMERSLQGAGFHPSGA